MEMRKHELSHYGHVSHRQSPLVSCTRENTMGHMCLEQSNLAFCDYRISPTYISVLRTGGSEWQIQVELDSWLSYLAVHFLAIVAMRYCQEITQTLAEDLCTVEKHLHPLV